MASVQIRPYEGGARAFGVATLATVTIRGRELTYGTRAPYRRLRRWEEEPVPRWMNVLGSVLVRWRCR